MTDAIKDTLASAASAAREAVTGLPPAPATDAYLRWDAPGVESVGADEAAKAGEIAAVVNRMQERNFAKHRRAFRGTHVKAQGVVKGRLEVRDDLPAHLRQGMFAVPNAAFDVAARYANEPYLLQPDQAPGPRGLSLKVFGVSGPRLEGAPPGLTTQDWFFNNAPSIELTDIDTTLDIMSLREKYFDDPTGLGVQLKLRRDALKQHAPYQLPNTNMISHSFYTQSAFRFGDYYGHLGLFPVLDAQTQHNEAADAKGQPETVLSDWLQDYFRGADARYELRIQLGTDPRHHPTEDGSVVWDEATAPYQTLATLTFPRQNSFSPARYAFWEAEMSLSPWRGLDAHRPLGSINRLRKYVYDGSMKKRDEFNATSSHDVSSIDQIPD